MSSSLSQAVRSLSLSLSRSRSRSSLPLSRSWVPGVSEVGSEFWRGISGLGEPTLTLSLRAEPVWSCRDWEPDMELEWVFTGTRWAICGTDEKFEHGGDKDMGVKWREGSKRKMEHCPVVYDLQKGMSLRKKMRQIEGSWYRRKIWRQGEKRSLKQNTERGDVLRDQWKDKRFVWRERK